MKPFLIIQLRPEDETTENEFESILRFGQLAPEHAIQLRLEREPLPDIDFDTYSGIIVGGSPFDISTPPEEKSDVQLRVEADFATLFDHVVTNDFPFIGACSGNGLLGNYCGAHISKTYGEPVGGVDVTITDEGKTDPLLRGFPKTFRALVGHKEACDVVPENAVLLASSTTCPVQMFRVGQNVYATQFHPEADASVFTLRINIYKHHGYFAPETAADLITAVETEETPYANEVLRRFVERYSST